MIQPIVAGGTPLTPTLRGLFPRTEGPNGETIFVHSPIWRKYDFIGDLIDDELNVCLGSDAQAAGALSAGIQSGAIRLTSGNNSGTASDDIAMLNSGLNFKASQGDVGMEVRLRMNTAITGGTMGVGFTDVLSSTGSTEEPSSIATATLTTNASDGLGLIFDTGATVKDWFAWGVKGDTDSIFTDTTYAPVADTWEIIRVELDKAGNGYIYRNGILIASQTAALTASVLLTPYVYVNATTTASVVVDVDYFAMWGGR